MKIKDIYMIQGGGKRLAMKQSSIDNWFVSYSPRNHNKQAEGSWEDWVELAHEIILKDIQLDEEERN